MNAGPHVILPTAAAKAWVQKADVVKVLDDPSLLAEANAGSLLIFRAVADDWGTYLHTDDGAETFASLLLGRLKGFRAPGRLYVELLNEVPPSDTTCYVSFAQKIVPILHDAGVLVAGPSWATGDYELEDWQAWRKAGWAGLDAIAVHAYWNSAGFTQWNALRWRQFYDENLDQRKPVFVTECGRAQVRDGAGGTWLGHNGWRADGIAADAYRAECVAYAKQLHSHEYATFFTAGPTETWQTFTLDDLASDLAAQLVGGPAVNPPSHPTNGGNVPQDELTRYYSDLWKRFGADYVPGHGLSDKWKELQDQNSPLGAPLEPEHRTENGQWIYQMFSSGRSLYAGIDKDGNLTTEVNVGLPPLS
jgi:hypothetical protein